MFNDGDPTSINSDLGVDDQADLLPYNKSFEFERDKLKLGKQLGSGAFGRVVKAQAIGINSWERLKITSLPKCLVYNTEKKIFTVFNRTWKIKPYIMYPMKIQNAEFLA